MTNANGKSILGAPFSEPEYIVINALIERKGSAVIAGETGLPLADIFALRSSVFQKTGVPLNTIWANANTTLIRHLRKHNKNDAFIVFTPPTA